MSIPTAAMRSALKTVYTDDKGKPRRKWVFKINKMSDEQVVAVYRNLQQQNKL